MKPLAEQGNGRKATAPVPDADEYLVVCPTTATRLLTAARKTEEFEVVELELASGVSMNTVYAWAKGVRDPRLSNFVAFAMALGFEVVLRRRSTPGE